MRRMKEEIRKTNIFNFLIVKNPVENVSMDVGEECFVPFCFHSIK